MVPNKRADGSNFPPSSERGPNAGRRHHPGNWGTYAAAAGAALAMSTNASADIVYSGTVDVTVSVGPGGGRLEKPFTVAGFDELLGVGNSIGSNFKSGIATVSFSGIHELRFFGSLSNGVFDGKNYHLGQAINGADASFELEAVLRLHSTIRGRTINLDGAWGPGTVTSFLGFEVQSGPLAGDLGWLEVKVSDAGSPGYPNEAEIIAWAYNNTGAAIPAGAIPTPEPSAAALGLLAIGAAGILAFRKRRNELAPK